MVRIDLPLHIGVDPFASSVEVLGIKLQYVEAPVVLESALSGMLGLFRNALQFREGDPQDTVDVAIRDRSGLVNALVDIFKGNAFVTDMSVEQPFLDHLSEALAVELSKQLGLNAISSSVQIPASDALFEGMAESLVSNIEASPLLRQFLYEQYFQQSPDRFPAGTDAVYAAIPFAEGDSLSFFLTVRFQEAIINGDAAMPLSMFMAEEDMPVVKFVVRFSFSS